MRVCRNATNTQVKSLAAAKKGATVAKVETKATESRPYKMSIASTRSDSVKSPPSQDASSIDPIKVRNFIERPFRSGDRVVANDCVIELDVCRNYKDYIGYVTVITSNYVYAKNLNGNVMKWRWGP